MDRGVPDFDEDRVTEQGLLVPPRPSVKVFTAEAPLPILDDLVNGIVVENLIIVLVSH